MAYKRWLVALIGLACWAFTQVQAAELPINTKLGGDFELPSTLDKPARLSDFKGKVVLLNFGYTHCPDICPMVLNRMAAALNELEDDRKQVQPVFITFDPERDTQARLKEYLAYFGKDFVGFTGTADELTRVAKQYGVIAFAQKTDSAAGKLYTHSDYVYLLDQQGRVRALYSKSDSISKIVDGMESLLDD